MDISLKIRQLIKEKNTTQKELADKIGFSVPAFNTALKRNDLKISTLRQIAEVFGVSICKFFDCNSTDLHIKKTYYTLRKYRTITEIGDSEMYQGVFDFLSRLEIRKPLYDKIRLFPDGITEAEISDLFDKFYKSLFDIYEVQELFIKGYITEESDKGTPAWETFLRYEKNMTVKPYSEAIFKNLIPLSIIKIRDGYEHYFSEQIM